ncbi:MULTISPECIES: multiple monosaccharide ABC transporter ATP-binding protein [unclassified Herbaspirillum]|uniref:multiple monosaccharide ABC transporter ATP-binding protein n=1 Tax=unclassified Herbaspirillum TaxID=2624150 RepID=UPI001152DD6C|nr:MULTISPECIES: multiple monosaccharide ABC transporter ATP-binding protein [unclassified Herbaspirillum]MBB5390669.1 putative multiple sugar transport system ATP-binding protein [Herbaspirillum sp. SJZ102]TQK08845.1 multiple monosaccharide ABC transporter ATP-binding protein [Herbaspirillum sp. SJZ130]TQK14468.1 multiple monosaccharide ABC transporter ATP-binding protein [Herbaspirillum sp. SJZ106]TWC66515.1 multiple monosaccharide ABC transporter ATP-binding protein [Herbaspirillum sp. SJZ09
MNNILEMRGIEKTFPGVKALNNVNLAVREGEIHAIVGENGAGKSTLMKVLSGVYPHGSYSGDIVYKGDVRSFKDIRDSEHLGIIIIHQELALVPLLSVMENLFLGNEQARGGVIDWEHSYVRAKELLAKVGLKESPLTLVNNLGVGKQQLIEIAKALSKEVKLLILDEPTASLNESDSDALLELLLELKSQGISSILISHKLNEISKVADSITVLRDGATVDTFDCRAEPISEDRIIQNMVGREMADRYPQRDPQVGEVIFEVRDWRVHHPVLADRLAIKDVNMSVRAGEIVGIAGLMGSGRTELAKSIFGRAYGKKITGKAFLHGKEVDLSTIQKAIRHGIAYVTEDRKGDGLVLEEDIKKNISLANLGGVSERTVIDEAREYKVANDFRGQMRIRCSSVLQKVVNLSGGNQQKVVLSKWLFSSPEVLILDEPTRGIDVGAKFEIYNIISKLAAEGKCIIMISSEMPELLGMCDRIYVMNEGQFVGQFERGEASQESIMRAIMRNKRI